MGRLILLAAFVAIIVFAVAVCASLIRQVAVADGWNKGDHMPKSFQNIAYVLLIIVMFGVATGWLVG